MFRLACRRRGGSLLATAAAVVALLVVVPPSPLSAQTGGYGDMPDDAYYTTPVADLAAESVFDGTECEAGFCPGEAIDRKTMAVWMVRVLDGADPPAVAQTRFDDVDAGSFYAPFIERLAELEVTQGCGDGSGFCPDRTVTRAQMAVLISRAYDLPEGPDPGFTDVPANAWYADHTARLAASKISVGCGDGTKFCPGRDTTRAQMATFLWRAENPDWQTAIDEQSLPPDGEASSPAEGQFPPDGEQSSPDEQVFLLSSNPDGDTFTFLGTRSSGPSTVQTRGEFSVPVFLCGPTDHFTVQYMTALVDGLNEEIAPVFNRQSSGLVNVRFEAGSVISPDVPWDTVHNLFDDAESNPCMDGARAISGARHIFVVAYDEARINCAGIGTLVGGFSFLRVNPNVTPQATLGAMYWPALYGTAAMVLGIQPLEPYGSASLFAYAIEENDKLIDLQRSASTWLGPDEDTLIIMSCYQHRQLGWPVNNNRPPCYGLTPVGSAVSVVPGEQSLSVTWTAPTLSDGVPVTGYALRLYEHEPTAFSRFSFDPLSQQTLVAQYQALSSERSHTFEDLDPSSSYTIELDLRSRYGRTVVSSEVFRVMASADTVGVTELGPSGFTLSWNPVQGASRYLSGFGETYFIESPFSGYGSGIWWDGPPFSYGVTDENDNAYWTTDPSRHPQGDLLPDTLSGGVRTELRRRSSYASFSDDQPYWDTVSNWYVRSDPNGTSFTSDQGILPDTTYTVRIMACRDDGDVIWPHSCHNFAIVTVITPSAPALNPPDEITVTAGNTWVELAWDSVPGAESYEICGFYPLCIHRLASSAEVYISLPKEERITGLEPETTYAFEVKSCVSADSVGAGYSESGSDFLCGSPISSSVTTAATQPDIAPDRPGPVTATGGDTWIKLEWNAVPNADEYLITIDGSTRTGLYVDDVQPGNRIRYNHLQPETDHAFKIQACRTVGSTRTCSNARPVTASTAPEPDTRPPPPDPPTGFISVEVFDTSVTAEWDSVPGAEEYRFSLNGNPFPWNVDASPIGGTNIPVPRRIYWNLEPDSTYTIGVSVCKIVGVSFVCSADATLSVTTGAPGDN